MLFYIKKFFVINSFLSVLALVCFMACDDSSSGADSQDSSELAKSGKSSNELSSAQCEELYGISEENSWSLSITDSSMLKEEVCSKTTEFIEQEGGVVTVCEEVNVSSESKRIEILLNLDYGRRKVWVDIDGCKYKLGTDRDFNTLVAKASVWTFDNCLCKVEKGKTYYRNAVPKVFEESSSSVFEVFPFSSEEFDWNSSSSVSYVPPLDAVAGTMVDERDNHKYKTVTIGTQTWMAENLAYAYVEPTKTLDSSSFCDTDDSKYCETYGRLYLWSAAMDSSAVFSEDGKGCGYDYRKCANENNDNGKIRGICPEGWHLPNVAEYKTLFKAIGGENTPGDPGWRNVEKALKSLEGWNEYNGRDANGFDDYGFNVMPAGQASVGEEVFLYDQGSVAFFWTSDSWNDFSADIIAFHHWTPDVSNSGISMKSFLSIRCLKD